MRQLLFLLVFMLSLLAVQAQSKDTTLNEYVGKYNFPEGSFITSAEMTVTNNGLYVSSAQGSSPLEKKAKDTFALVNYDGGMVYFARNENGKVIKVKVEVSDILLEGTKENVTAFKRRNFYLLQEKKQLVK